MEEAGLVPVVTEKLDFNWDIKSLQGLDSANKSPYSKKKAKSKQKRASSPRQSSARKAQLTSSNSSAPKTLPLEALNVDPDEQQKANKALKALDDFIREEIKSAQKLFAWKDLSASEKALFIFDILVRAGITGFMSIFTGLLYMGTGTAAGLKMQQEWHLPIIWAKILAILADIEGSASNAVLNSEGGIDFKKTIEEVATKFAAKNCRSCVSEETLKKLGLIDTLSYNPDETRSERRWRLAKTFGRITGKVFFTVSSAGVYYFLAKQYGIPTFITGAAANGLGVSGLSWLNPKLPVAQQTVVDYLKRSQLEPILNLLDVDPEEGMQRLRRLKEYTDKMAKVHENEENDEHVKFRQNLDLLYLALSLTSSDPLTSAPKEYLEKTQPTPARSLFAKIVYGISVSSIGGYVYDVAYGVYSQFKNFYVQLAMGFLATLSALPPFYGLSTGAANRVGAELFSDQASLASLIKTSFLKYTRYGLIGAGYAFTAGSGFTNWLLNLIFANQVISWLTGTAQQCFNQTVVNATDLFKNYTAPIFTSVYQTVSDEMSHTATVLFQNSTTGEVCPDQRTWFAIFVANLYAMVGMIGAPVTNLFYWLLMTDNLTVYLAEHGCTNKETQEMVALVKMFRGIVSGVESTDPTQFARMLNKIFKPIGQHSDGSYVYTHLAQQLFAILDKKLSPAEKIELDKIINQPQRQAPQPGSDLEEEVGDEVGIDMWEGAKHVWDQLQREPELNNFIAVQEKDFLDDAKTKVVEKNRGTGRHVSDDHPLLQEDDEPKNRCCNWGKAFNWFRSSERTPLVSEQENDFEMAYSSSEGP